MSFIGIKRKTILILTISLVVILTSKNTANAQKDKWNFGIAFTPEYADGTAAEHRSNLVWSGGITTTRHLNNKVYVESGIHVITRGYSQEASLTFASGADPAFAEPQEETYILRHLSVPFLIRIGHKLYFKFGPSVDYRLRLNWISGFNGNERVKLDIEDLRPVVITGHIAFGYSGLLSQSRNLKWFLETRINGTITNHISDTAKYPIRSGVGHHLINFGFSYGVVLGI